jgi:hypothetical protein
MKAQLVTATLITTFSGVLSAANQQLLNLVMPDAKVVAGVNVQHAKGTQFGQWVLNQLSTPDANLQQLIALTGFDPRRDVQEVIVASDGTPGSKTGLAVAFGSFDPNQILAAATQHGAVTESYGSMTIIEDPKQQGGLAFLSTSIVAAGDIASVKGAIDRLTTPQALPATVMVTIGKVSNAQQDAWGVTTVPPASLVPPNAVKNNGQPNPLQNATQSVQSAAGSVQFGAVGTTAATVVFSGQATCDTAANAQTLSDLLKLMINIGLMQAGNDPNAAALLKSANVTFSGPTVSVSASLPEDVFISIVQPTQTQATRHRR